MNFSKVVFVTHLLISSFVLDTSAMIDIGVNLAHKRFNGKVDQVLRDAASAGVTGIIITGTSLGSSRKAIDLIRRTQETYGITLKCTVGVHPHSASDFVSNRGMEESLEALVRANADIVVAIGETGLDYNRNFSPPNVQRMAFEKQMALANKLQLPTFLHNRDAHDDFVAILERFPNVPKCVHCHTDPIKAHLDAYIAMGAMIGQTGWITDERRGTDLCKIVPHIPPNRLLIETDAPFLTPQNMPAYMHKRPSYNEPAYLPYVAQKLALLYGRTTKEMIDKTTENAKRFFKF